MGYGVGGCEAAGMTSTLTDNRLPVLMGPLLLVLYGVLRLVDGRDGVHGPGLAWNLGHTAFFFGFVLFGVVTLRLQRLVSDAVPRARGIVRALGAASLFGVVCFLWVILGDLFAGLDAAAPLPEPLQLIGPLAFELGWLTLLGMLAAAKPRRLPVWSPLSVLVGFVLFTADLDLLPIGGLFLAAGLAQVARVAGPTVSVPAAPGAPRTTG